MKTYTVKEATEILKVDVKTVRDYIHYKRLPAAKIGKSWIIREESLESFLQEHEQQK